MRALAARGRTLVSGSYDCTVRIWDIISGECKWALVGHTQKGTWRRSVVRFPHELTVDIQFTALSWIYIVILPALAQWTEQYVYGT